MSESALIIPSEIPWADLKAKELEELLYWLLESMGAKDLEWRIGGSGGGAADQGRDLECSFHMSSPTAELTRQHWWIEAKGRSKTVEPTDVKEAVLNAVGKQFDVFLVATNSYFSNPTRDWVKVIQSKHPHPIVRLWDRTELEKLCSTHPLAAIRLFTKSLNPQGKLEVTRTRLWNYVTLIDEPTLASLWSDRDSLEISPTCLIALLVSECTNGDVTRRPWGMLVTESALLATFVTFLSNVLFLVFRADERGVGELPFTKAGAYIMLCCIHRLGKDKTTSLLSDWSDVDGSDWSTDVKQIIVAPLLERLTCELRDVCTSNCTRIGTQPAYLNKGEIERYWKRFEVNEECDDGDPGILWIERKDAPCNVGFRLNSKTCCPLIGSRRKRQGISKTIDNIARIIRARTEHHD